MSASVFKRSPSSAPYRASCQILVLGGSGFVGRHAVSALCRLDCPADCHVVIGSRNPAKIDARLPPEARRCERRQVSFQNMQLPGDWTALLADIDTVINCVGILRPRGRETYELVHHLAPAALATACRDAGCRLIHVSALGLDAPARSGFLRSKRAGEAAVRASGSDWYIVRPSLLDGDGGFGAKWLRRMARWPVHPLPADSAGRIAALDVRDLGEALARLALAPQNANSAGNDREFELGGLDPRTLGEHLAALRRLHSPRPARRVPIPGLLARLGSHLCDLLHFSPFSFGHWELLRRDNLPVRNRLPELLGRAPRLVGKSEAPPVGGLAGGAGNLEALT